MSSLTNTSGTTKMFKCCPAYLLGMVAQQVANSDDTDENFFDGHTPKDQLLDIRVQDKPKFTTKAILDFLELNKGNGATVSDIVNATGFNRDTISKHLTYLAASRQVYTTNGTSTVYHKNGRVLHYKNMKNRVFDKRFYTFYLLQQNFDDDYVYIQEKEVGRFKSVSVKGGIMVKLNDFKNFINELENFASEIKEDKIESKTPN